MPKKAFDPILSASAIQRYQRRLSSYLNDHEYRHNVQAKEVAEKIGITSQKFSYVKSQKKPYSRFISSLDLLARFANLEQMSIVEFLQYLEGQRDKEKPSSEEKLYGWQRTIVDAFEPVRTLIRGSFTDICKDSLAEGKDKLEVMIEILALLRDKDLETLKSLKDTLKRLI